MKHPIKSWSRWFDECAKHYKDVRMKMAYYEDGKPLSPVVMRRIHQDVLKKFPVKKSSVLLDVGGGVGLFSKIFYRRVKKVVLTDISPTMIRAARQLNPKGTFSVCDAAKLPFADQSFDRLLCYSVFHYFGTLSQVRKVLDEFVRMIKPGGMIFIGDVLYPENEIAEKCSCPSSASSLKGLIYPKKLSHNLTKLKISPSFFKAYCLKKGLKCKILMQDIRGKKTSGSRYDVVLKMTKG